MMYASPYHTADLSKYSFLITGGAGFIGSNLVEYLLKYKAKKVRVLDNLSTGFRANLAAFEHNESFDFIQGDITNLEDCKQALIDIDYVSHQAALGSVPRSIENPLASHQANVNGFLNMLLAYKENPKVKKMVYAASSSTYGDSKELPKVEQTIGRPLSPYAVTKYVNELYAEVFAKTYNLNIIGLRYFNVFGPKQSPKGAYAAVIPIFIESLHNNIPPVINGDGNQTRDFTFVENAVQANVKAFFAGNEGDNTVYNIACGERISLNELWAQLKKISNKPEALIHHGPERQGDVRDSLANIDKAKKLLGYNPKFSVKEGLQKTWKF